MIIEVKKSAKIPTLVKFLLSTFYSVHMIPYTEKNVPKKRKFRWERLHSYMRKGFLICEEMRKYLVIIYEEAVSHI